MPRARRPPAEVHTDSKRKRVAESIFKGQVEAQPTVAEDAASKTVQQSEDTQQSMPVALLFLASFCAVLIYFQIVSVEIPKYEQFCPPSRRTYSHDEESEEEEAEPSKPTRAISKRGTLSGKKSITKGKRSNPDCSCLTSHKDIPDWPFILSEGVVPRLLDLARERIKRDQDLNGIYFYNHFNGYGIAEVFENYVSRILSLSHTHKG